MKLLNESLKLRDEQFDTIFQNIRRAAEYCPGGWPDTRDVRDRARAIRDYAESLLWLCDHLDSVDFRYSK